MRIQRIMNKLQEQGVSQMLVTDPMSIYYMTGIYLEPYERFFALLLRQSGEHVLFVNNLFAIDAEIEIKKVWYSDTDPVMEYVQKYVNPSEVLGVDKDLKARFLIPLIECNAAKAFKNTSLAIDLLRGVKDEEEQIKMRKSSRMNDEAMTRFTALVREGITEKEIADQIPGIYQELGAEDVSFEPIVSFGANAADPHHMPDDTVLKKGDFVLFDVGCIKDGYCSDMTRTFGFGTVSEHQKEIYNLVLEANKAAIAKIRPGVQLCELDRTARDIITQAGYGPNFNHRLGHFIGLSEHEFGDVSSINERKAEPGMIFSIEPGVYVNGDIGVRIEDLVLVTEEGVEVLNHFSKELEIIEG